MSKKFISENIYIIDVSQILYRGSYSKSSFISTDEIIETDSGFDFKRINVGGLLLLLSRVIKYSQKGIVYLVHDGDDILKFKQQSEEYQYKAGRRKDTEMSIKEQKKMARALGSLINCHSYYAEEYEADDLMQSLVYHFHSLETDRTINMVNKDGDLFHLCCYPNVKMIVDGTSKKPDVTYDLFNHWQGRHPKYSLLDRLYYGKGSNNIGCISDTNVSAKLNLVYDLISSNTNLDISLLADPELFMKFILTHIESSSDLANRMYLLFPVIVRDVEFSSDVKIPDYTLINRYITLLRNGDESMLRILGGV